MQDKHLKRKQKGSSEPISERVSPVNNLATSFSLNATTVLLSPVDKVLGFLFCISFSFC